MITILIGIIFYKFFEGWITKAGTDLRRFVVVAFVLCLILSYVAEEYFGVADITGAFIAGLIISSTPRKDYIISKFDSKAIVVPGKDEL